MPYSNLPVGTKVESCDAHGYFILPLCGVITGHLPDGHAIIKSFADGFHYSTVSRSKKVKSIETI